jgi:hypothetical protein
VTASEPAASFGDGGLLRLRLDLAYDGTDFAGWAAQPGQRTVEQTLAEALGRVLRLDPPPRLVVAGRTDAGVHATGQVAHVDLPIGAWPPRPLPGSRPGSPRSGAATPTGSVTTRPGPRRCAGTTSSGIAVRST